MKTVGTIKIRSELGEKPDIKVRYYKKTETLIITLYNTYWFFPKEYELYHLSR